MLPSRASQDELRAAAVDVHGDGPASTRPNDDLGLVLIELGLGGCNRSGKVVVIQGRVDDGVAMILEVRRFDAAWNRVPAVEEEYLHEVVVSWSGGSALIVFAPFALTLTGDCATMKRNILRKH